MNITAKTRFGLKALMDIAYHHRVGPVQRRHIALRQGIPTDYMDQILMRLRNGGLIQSLRGREGGYHLALEPEEISVWDVVSSVEDEPYSAGDHSPEDSLAYATECITEPAWHSVSGAIEQNLKGVTLAQMLADAENRIVAKGLDPVDLMEQRPKSSSQQSGGRGILTVAQGS
jgi:Rrf2 family cysteine metabolism transcriptional repressor